MEMTKQERDLAAAVIDLAITEFIKDGDPYDFHFLIGETQIAQHWFTVLGMRPLIGEKELLRQWLRENKQAIIARNRANRKPKRQQLKGDEEWDEESKIMIG